MTDQLSRYAHGRLYTLKRREDGAFVCHWRQNGKARSRVTKQFSPEAAQAWLDDFVTADPARAAAPTCDMLWFAKFPEGETQRNDMIWKRLAPFFAGVPLNEVTVELERRYRAARLREVSESTLWLELSRLRTSWRHAVQMRAISADDLPVLDKLPEAPAPRERWLRDDEVARLLEAAKPYRRIWLFLHIALETGARRTTIQNLEWSQVDFETGVIHFAKPGRRQTTKKCVSVPMSKRLRPILAAAHLEGEPGEKVIGSGSNVNRQLGRVADKAGIEGVSPHVLRHTAATRMARAGVPLWMIAKVLGNSVQQVEAVYAKHSPEMLASAVDAISA